jgi:galactose-1-phosphate uridylyltransferase
MNLILSIIDFLERTIDNSLSRENYEQLDSNTYIIRTQAGFRKATRDIKGLDSTLVTLGFPATYPSVVQLVKDSQSSKLHCYTSSLSDYKSSLECKLKIVNKH